MIDIVRRGEKVAICVSPYIGKLVIEYGGASYSMTTFFAQRMEVEYQPMFRHLMGESLSSFFDHSEVLVGGDDSKYEDARYVHGRTELTRGSPSVSSVLLVVFDAEVPEHVFRAAAPEIYEEFLRTK